MSSTPAPRWTSAEEASMAGDAPSGSASASASASAAASSTLPPAPAAATPPAPTSAGFANAAPTIDLTGDSDSDVPPPPPARGGEHDHNRDRERDRRRAMPAVPAVPPMPTAHVPGGPGGSGGSGGGVRAGNGAAGGNVDMEGHREREGGNGDAPRTHGAPSANSGGNGNGKSNGNDGDSDSSDDIVITASTGPTRTLPAHRRCVMSARRPGTTDARTRDDNRNPHAYRHTQSHHPHPHPYHSSSSSSFSHPISSPHLPPSFSNGTGTSSTPHRYPGTFHNHPANFAPYGAVSSGFPSASSSALASASASGSATPHSGFAYSRGVSVPSLPALPGMSSAMSVPSLPGVPGTPSLPFAPGAPSIPGNGSYGDGSASAPIDVDQIAHLSPRTPICIGGFMSRAIMLYPKSAVTAGMPSPSDGTDDWEVVNYRSVEMLRVKLKLRRAGSIPRQDEPWSATDVDAIQVMTPSMATYIGDLDSHVASVLIPMLKRGLCRLEGFAVRIPPEGAQYECRINILIFTLPSNVRYIADTLTAHSLYLLDPLPPYDPSRHTDAPEYHNAHGSGERAMQLYQAHRRGQSVANGQFNPATDKARQVEVQRRQAEAIMDELGTGVELEESEPGFIRTQLFPHQRKALTFLLQGEQDQRSLKDARKLADRMDKKEGSAGAATDGSAKDGEKEGGEKEGVDSDASGKNKGKEKEEEKSKKDKKSKDKLDSSRSLWEGERNEKGRLRIWKNKITGEKVRLKKGERPMDCKGAILADDMGLGKTLSVVSLIAATRSAALDWAARPLEPVAPVDRETTPNVKLDASVMQTKIFGMPDADEELVNGKGKKRRRPEPEPTDTEVMQRVRRSRIQRRSKGTLLVCPMSTMTNWEDQIKEHWDGNVEVVGGLNSSGVKTEPKSKSQPPSDPDDFENLRVYIYHGPSRNMNPAFLSGFDIVITSYSTLANEYSKQCATCGDDETTPLDTGTLANSDDEQSRSSAGTLGTKTPDEGVKPAELAAALLNKGKGRKKAPARSGEQPSALQSIDWFRIVLDEAHNIKSSSTIACKASCALEADRRIALTGTPIQNKIDDVWALFKFLRLSPINEREVFSKYITTPCKTGDPVGVARLQLVMRTCTLRRTKDTITKDGKKILDLPPRIELEAWLDLREDERKIYDERLGEIQEDIQHLKATKQLTKNYAHVLQQLLRLRQTANHVDLPSAGQVEEDYDGTIMDYELACQGIDKYGLSLPRAQSVMSYLKDTDGALCYECQHDFGPLFPSIIGLGEDELSKPAEIEGKKAKKPVRPILTKCKHVVCPACFKRSVYSPYPKKIAGVSRQCPKCEKMLRLDLDIMEVTPPNSDEPEDIPKRVVRRKKWARKDGEDLILSTKMDWLKNELLRHSRAMPGSANYDLYGEPVDPSTLPADKDGNKHDSMIYDAEGFPIPSKGIIFSQWTTMLDRIEDMLIELKILYCRLDGTMTREQRAQAMEDLRTKPTVEVMLVSTRAGGVGLNLVSANRAYLVDPYWNPSVEAQAIDRVHRMGQKKPVTAIKLLIYNSVEERLIKLQKKKADLANLSLKNMSRQELLEQKADELAQLFS